MRQVGASGKSHATDAGGLCFNSRNDAMNYAAQVVERCGDWAARQGVRSLREDYIQGECEVILNLDLAAWLDTSDLKLVIRSVPFIDDELEGPPTLDHGTGKCSLILESDADEPSVIGASKVRHRPKDAVGILSIVRLKRQTEVDEEPIDVLATNFDYTVQIINAATEGEADFLGILPSKGDGSFAKGLVQSEAQFLNGGGSEAHNSGREFLIQSEINDLLAGLWVGLGDNFVTVRLPERLAGRFDLGDVFFSALD